MSLFDDKPSLSNLFSHSDEDEELNLFPKPFEEDTENFKYFPELKENLSEKPKPFFNNNENFINYFMQIDYNTPLNVSSSKSESDTPKKETDDSNEIKNENLLKKTKREKTKEKDNMIKDDLTGIIYYEKDDPVNFRKAKKRIQNRESAYRMKKMRKYNMDKLDEEINRLKEDNIKLINENISLKKEKVFLIDQIKFMQKIIKESNLEFKLKNLDNKDKENNNNLTYININKTKEPILYYDGSKQKIKGKLFNVFTICLLSIVYIIGDCSFDSGNEKDIKRNDQGITLNSIDEKGQKSFAWYYISKIILFIILGCILQWIKVAFDKIKEFIKLKRKQKFV